MHCPELWARGQATLLCRIGSRLSRPASLGGGLYMWSGQAVVPASGPNLHTSRRSDPGEHSAKGVKI